MQSIKCVFVGDREAGKAAVLLNYTSGQTDGYVPTVFDNYSAFVLVDGRPVSVGLWDTAGSSDYDRLRPLSYPGTNVFVLCFSVVQPSSFHKAISKFAPEIRAFSTTVPIVLAGTEIELRDKEDVVEKLQQKHHSGPITFEDGVKKAREIGAVKYVECSATTGQGIDELFKTAYCAVLFPKKKNRSVFSRFLLHFRGHKEEEDRIELHPKQEHNKNDNPDERSGSSSEGGADRSSQPSSGMASVPSQQGDDADDD